MDTFHNLVSGLFYYKYPAKTDRLCLSVQNTFNIHQLVARDRKSICSDIYFYICYYCYVIDLAVAVYPEKLFTSESVTHSGQTLL